MRALELSATGVGITLGAYGVGMVAGALLAARIMRVLSLGIVIAIGPVSGLAAGLVMMLTIWKAAPALAALSFLLMGAGPIVWVVSTTNAAPNRHAAGSARPRVGRQQPGVG